MQVSFREVAAGERWERRPSSIQDQMAIEAAKKGAGNRVMDVPMSDPRYMGWHKYEYRVKSSEGRVTIVHYVKNPVTGEIKQVKFKKRSHQ